MIPVIKQYPFKFNWTERQFFIYACFVSDLQEFYRDWIEQGRKIGRHQYFDVSDEGKLTHKYWNPSNVCCETGEILTPENIDVKIGYWNPFAWKPIRKDLRQQAMNNEAFECQKIDCSCNDCKHLDRENSQCKKIEKPIRIIENFCHIENQTCFEHRKG